MNKQPWRVVAAGNSAHFYEKSSRGFVSDAVGDMQRIDIGIALCHFMLAAQELGLPTSLKVDDPGIPAEDDTKYIATVTVG